ncbi:hypothetical protein ACCC88_00420 [Sphingomonas sp. Sphisp140]|uniref:hypothetical protein n=1 Tax=unclassified Sphingomonas TaxID=196159 RepID=UPI0039B0E1FC
MARKLKVFRTAIGFHDAYVAAPSQKAALEAWGAEANLFARGAAEVVDDPELSVEPLAHPGQVIRRSRGTEAEHLAALGAGDGDEEGRRARRTAKVRAKKPKPRPDRRPLDDAEAALVAAQREAERVAGTFRERERELARQRQAAERTAQDAVRKARAARDDEKTRYERALARWRG